MNVASRRHGHGDRAQQHRDEARDTQEACRAIDGRLDLRRGIFDVFDFLAGLLVRFEPFLELGDPGARSGKQLRKPYAAAGLHERGGFEIRLVHDQARRQLEERGALVRARNQDAGNTKRTRADVDLRAN